MARPGFGPNPSKNAGTDAINVGEMVLALFINIMSETIRFISHSVQYMIVETLVADFHSKFSVNIVSYLLFFMLSLSGNPYSIDEGIFI